MKLNFLERLLGSGFYTGYIPYASGTFASIVALAIYWIPGFENPYIIITATVLLFIYGIFIGNKFEAIYGKDPSQCTIDEVVGMWLSLLFLPKSIVVSLYSFLIWRILDILKPPPARDLEKMKGGLGIMLDDFVSGIYTLMIVRIIIAFFKI